LSPVARNLLAALVVILYLGVWVFDHDVWAPTEPTVAGIVWEMYTEGDWVVPRINGLPYLEKPPLYYWLATAACHAGGRVSAGLIRLPAALLGLLCLWVTYRLARRRYGGTAAMLTALMAATFTSFFEYAHRASTDMAANFFAFLCLAIFADTIERAEESPRAERRADLLFALALAVSFYSKNFYTFLVVLPPVLGWLAWKRRYARGLFIVGVTLGLTALLATPWAMALYHRGGWEFLRIVFVDNTVGRFFQLKDVLAVPVGPLNDAYHAEKQNPRWLYLGALVMMALPWVLALGAAAANLFRRWREVGDFRRFLGWTLAAVPLVLSLSSSKVVEYLTPIFLVEWLILAGFLRDALSGGTEARPWERRLLWANVWIMAVGALAAPVALVFVLGHAWPLLWLGPAGFFVWHSWTRAARWTPDAGLLRRMLTYTVLTFLAALAFLAPWLNAAKTTEPFFNAIRREASGRALYTTYCDDRRLPLIPYYLRRKPTILEDREAVFALLRGDRPVGIILPAEFYHARRAEFAAIPHTHIAALRGKTFFAFVGNLPPGGGSATGER